MGIFDKVVSIIYNQIVNEQIRRRNLMAKVTVDDTRCKGCGLCISACPKDIMKLDENKINSKGYNPAACVDMDACIGCAFCATMCPEVCIKVEK